MRSLKILIIIIFLLSNFSLYGQTSLSELDIIFKHDFNENTLGGYKNNEWSEDWHEPEWCNRQDELDIVQDLDDYVNSTKTLKLHFPANSLGPEEGGTHWQTFTTNSYEEAYFSYDVMFMPGFDFNKGGKLPGIKGGSPPGDLTKPDGYDGFTSWMMFKGSTVAFYIYFPDSELDMYGSTFLWGENYSSDAFSPSKIVFEYTSGKTAKIETGVWHNITFRVVLNTVGSNGGNYDGILEAYFDGELVTQISHILFRHTTNIKIDCISLMSFFGGNTDDWRNPIYEWLKIDNVMLYTFKSEMDVVRGNQLSPTDRTINYWRKINKLNETVPEAPTSLTSPSQEKRSITLRWSDNSDNERGFKIYRRLDSEDSFEEIDSAGINETTFTDADLTPNTIYYYYVCAYNDKGNSDQSNEIQTKTKPLVPPVAPDNLSIEDFSASGVTIRWNDNSNNETHFDIQRSEITDGNFTRIAWLDANNISYSDSTIREGIKYYYRIRAYNEDGYSSFSNTVMLTTLIVIAPPESPTSLRLSTLDTNMVELIWNDNSDNELGFIIQRYDSTVSDFQTIDTTEANITYFTDNSLSSGNQYLYRIIAYNDDGLSDPSNTLAVFTPVIITPPDEAPDLSLVEVGFYTATIRWLDNSLNEEGFQLERKEAEPDSSWILFDFRSDTTEIIDTGLTPGFSYWYRIRAYNDAGYSDYSDTLTIQTIYLEPPQPPTSLKTVETDHEKITISWVDNSTNEDKFIIKRSLSIDTSNIKEYTVKANDTIFTDRYVDPNTTYLYNIEAVNNAGIAMADKKIQATTLSVTEGKRIRKNLIAYYNFNYSPDNIVYDLSGYKEPLNLIISKPEAIVWDKNQKPQFVDQILLVSERPAAKIVDILKKRKEITIECWLKPKFTEELKSTIVQLGLDESNLGFQINQHNTEQEESGTFNYGFRLHTESTTSSGFPEISPLQRIKYINLNHLVYTRDSSGNEAVYINNEKKAEGYRPESFTNWKNHYYLTIGNDLLQNSPWYGSIYSLAIYSSVLTQKEILQNYHLGPCDNNYENYQFDFDLNIKPNIVNGSAVIEILPKDFFGNVELTYFTICNAFGQVYHEESIVNPSEDFVKEMDFSAYPSGVYFLNVLSGTSSKTIRFTVF